jgi:leader peptidase (prepilin peptidase)/N-methyltransferase
MPLVSWLALRGRCRTCRAWIGWRYPLVELAIVCLWAIVAWQFLDWAFVPGVPDMALYRGLAMLIGRLVFYWLLVALAVFDAEYLWLPNWWTWPGIAMGFVYSIVPLPITGVFALASWGGPTPVRAAIAAVLAMSIAAGLILLIRWIYWLIRRREGIGLGDAKLMALLAAWIGLPGALLAFVLGVVLGALFALGQLAVPTARNQSGHWVLCKLPLGTFLCIGGIVSSLWGQAILNAYLRWAGF